MLPEFSEVLDICKVVTCTEKFLNKIINFSYYVSCNIQNANIHTILSVCGTRTAASR